MMLTFKKPSTKKILIFPSGSEINDNYLIKIFKKKNCEIYHGKKKVNFHIALDTILKFGFKNFSENYFKNYISITEPQYAATLNDLDKKFYKIKRINPKIILLSFQNGTRLPHQYKNLKGEKVDYYFTFGRYYSNLAKKSIKGKFIEIGSFRNNFFKNTKLEKKSIIFVSVYKPNHGKISPGERKLLKYLEKFCMKYNYELNIFGRQKYDYKTIGEYKNLIKGVNCKFINNDLPYYSIYKLYDLFDLFIFERSTAAYETIAAGKKTLVFNFYNEDKKWYQSHNMTDNFPHTDLNPTEGPFWSHECEYSQFESKTLNIINMKQENWDKISKPFISKIMDYNYQNKKFKKIFNQLVNNKIE